VAHTLASIPSSITAAELQRVGLKLEDLQNQTILQGRAIKLEDLGQASAGNVSQVSASVTNYHFASVFGALFSFSLLHPRLYERLLLDIWILPSINSIFIKLNKGLVGTRLHGGTAMVIDAAQFQQLTSGGTVSTTGTYDTKPIAVKLSTTPGGRSSKTTITVTSSAAGNQNQSETPSDYSGLSSLLY